MMLAPGECSMVKLLEGTDRATEASVLNTCSSLRLLQVKTIGQLAADAAAPVGERPASYQLADYF
jgi:hypothetical protein